jgi:hypothetical protein
VITPVIATSSETTGHMNIIHIAITDLEYIALQFIMPKWKIFQVLIALRDEIQENQQVL